MKLALPAAAGGGALLRRSADIAVCDALDGGLPLLGFSKVWRLTAVKRVCGEGRPWCAREKAEGL